MREVGGYFSLFFSLIPPFPLGSWIYLCGQDNFGDMGG